MTLDFKGLTKAEPFFVEFVQTYIHGNTLGTKQGNTPAVLFLHDEDSSGDRNTFLLLREALLDQYEISSCAFDFIGHGTTGGVREESSLSSRTKQAANIVNACFDSQPFTIVASGMGAYTAIKLTELFPVDGLVLIAPKVYAIEKYCMSLASLTDSAHFPDHWDKTDAWSIIERFKGSLSILGTNKGDPLCSGTMSRLYSHAIRSTSRHALEISNYQSSGESLAFCDLTSKELMYLARVIKRTCNHMMQKEKVYLA